MKNQVHLKFDKQCLRRTQASPCHEVSSWQHCKKEIQRFVSVVEPMNIINRWNEDVHNKQLTSLAHVEKLVANIHKSMLFLELGVEM